MLGTVDIKIDHGVAEISFYSPQSNACDPDLLEQLIQAIEDQQKQPSIRVILLCSKGDKAFCGGASIKHLAAVKTLPEASHFFSGFGRLMLAMKNSNKIIVTAVQGKAVGGGVGIIAASDYVIATDKAGLRLSELHIGIGPLVIAPAVIRKLGVASYSSLSLQPLAWKNAHWALEKGLFNEVIAAGENLKDRSHDFAQTLSNYTPKALVAMKKSLWHGCENWEELLLENALKTAQLSLSKEAQESFKKFNA